VGSAGGIRATRDKDEVLRSPGINLEAMPPILNAQWVTKQFGAVPLFRNISLTVEDGDRIGLIGPNGAGKSTLLALLAGQVAPDEGELAVRKRARTAYVPQESRFEPVLTVRDVLERAITVAHVGDAEREGRIRELAGRTGFDRLDAEAASLSGGWRKRLAIAEALVSDPDVLLLDEPTNHLDVAGIEWLEELLTSSTFAAITVSHDRYFLESTSSQIIELNRIFADGLFRVKGAFSRFLEEKQAYLEAQNRQMESLRNRVGTEIEWLRRGPKARATKAKARIDTANAMIGRLAEMDTRTTTASAGIDFASSQRKTKRLVEFEGVVCELVAPATEASPKPTRRLFEGLNSTLTAGMKVGLVGPNGSGKTTLLRLLRGEIEPSAGSIRRAEALRLVYFSQTRELDENVTLRRALAPEGDSVIHQGRPVHVASWAARFLFTGEQLNQPVRNLSGGERARVLIARLMLEPADVLLLDEPTNDLDIPTLEILEDNLVEFPGALVLVTHDRYLLNRVATTVLGLDGRGHIGQFADFAQWETWVEEQSAKGRDQRPGFRDQPPGTAATPSGTESGSGPGPKKKLSYLEAREFATIEQRVEESDARLAAAHRRMDDPSIASDAVALQEALAELELARQENHALYARWAELTEKAG
jgi:ATP-binding cassette subfamily F protein uup